MKTTRYHTDSSPRLTSSLPPSPPHFFSFPFPPGDNELSADVKVAVSSVVVQHARLIDSAVSPDRFPQQTATEKENEKGLDDLEPIISWGTAVAWDTATVGGGDVPCPGADKSVDPRSAKKVQRCLIEIARGSPQPDPAVGETGVKSELRGNQGRTPRRPAEDVPVLSPMLSTPVSPHSTGPPMSEACALRYRLLKQKSGDAPSESPPRGGSSDAAAGAVSTLIGHDIAVGALRVQLAEVLLEKLLRFSGVVSRPDDGSSTKPADDPSGEEAAAAAASAAATTAPPSIMAPVSLVHVQGQPPRASRLSPRASDAGSGSALSSPRALPPRPPTSSLEVALHVALRSIDFALDLAGPRGGFHGAREHGEVDRAAFCVVSLSQLAITGSESSLVGEQQQQRGGQPYAMASPRRRDEDESQRVCSLVLGSLSVALVDGSVLAVAEDVAPLVMPGSPPPPTLMSRALAQEVFLAGGSTTGVRRLVGLAGARVTAEILSKPVGDVRPGGGAWSAAADGAARRAPDFLFNASLDSVEVCASVGAALLILDVCQLVTKMNGRLSRAGAAYAPPRGTDRWGNGWRHGVGVAFEGVSIGGVVKSGGGQLTGNMHRLSVGRVGGGVLPLGGPVAATSDVAVFEALPGEGEGEALSWALEISDDAGLTGVKLTAVFKSATLNYKNTKKAFGEMTMMVDEWNVGAAHLAAGSPAAAASRRSLPFEFDIRGSAVALHLPFDLKLEVENVHVGTPPGIQAAALARDSGAADGDLDIDLEAGEVRVYHHTYGAVSSPDDASPPAIQCAARGIVTVRPGENATAVFLESEHVWVRLTPAFCASFGLFVRFMVGPPPRPLEPDSPQAIAARGRPPNSFTFELKVGTVDVDFLTGPCSPSAVSAAFVVGGVSLRQHATGAAAPEAGSQASFEMSFDAVEATQRRDPWRNAPALPQEAAQLIEAFLGRAVGGGDGAAPGSRVFSAWLSARRGERGRGGTPGLSYMQPFLVALGKNEDAQAFSVVTTSSGPRHRLVNSLSLRLAPVLLACYPPTFRILVGHYNRFAANAFRPFRSRADMPLKVIAVISYDIDIRGCSAVLLASLVDGARGIHVSAGEVTFKENRAAAVALPTGMGAAHASSSTLAAGAPAAADITFAMSGFVGPVGIEFLQDWGLALPAPAPASAGASASGVGAGVQLCAPIDLRWAVFYDNLDRCRQDVSLSSVQLYLEQPHFDLCVRVAQIFVAADFPGALPPALPLQAAYHPEPAAASTHGVAGNTAKVESFLATSLRLPLVQFVLANGKRNGPLPPVLEFDVASVRLARGGVFTVKHLSVNSWSQEVDAPPLSDAAAAPATNGRDGGGCGYRVLGRSGQSEESGKDFLRMEVRVPEVRAAQGGTLGPRQPQLDVVFQVRVETRE